MRLFYTAEALDERDEAFRWYEDRQGVAGPDENGQRSQLDARPGNRSEVGHVKR